jgi:hydroxymethylglutaryl-CoA lyase
MTNLIRRATAAGLNVRAGVQCAFGCVYEGKIAEDKVVSTSKTLALSGATELNLADTTGMANPQQIRRMIHRVQKALPDRKLSLHLHDTRGLGLVNMFAGYEAGVTIFDVATGGMGGCPFVKGATGNVPTEDAVNLFTQINVDVGINLEKLCRVVGKLETIFGRALPGRMYRVFQGMKGMCK